MRKVNWAFNGRRAGALALSGGVLAAAAVPALASSSTSYRGHSSQGLPVTIVVAGKQIKRLTIVWSASCPVLHAPLKGITTYHEGVVLKRSAWSTWGTYGAQVPGGYDERFYVRDHGVFAGARRVRGVFTGSVQIYHGVKHTRIDTCQSGKVTFTLARVR